MDNFYRAYNKEGTDWPAISADTNLGVCCDGVLCMVMCPHLAKCGCMLCYMHRTTQLGMSVALPCITDMQRLTCIVWPGDPQTITVAPTIGSVTTTSATVSWVHPGGEVESYLIRYTQNGPPNPATNVTADGHINTTTLTGLQPGTSYRVEVFTVNVNGISAIPSPSAYFNTTSITSEWIFMVHSQVHG